MILENQYPYESSIMLNIENIKARKTLIEKINNYNNINKKKPNPYIYREKVYKNVQKYEQPLIDSDYVLDCNIESKPKDSILMKFKGYPEFIPPTTDPDSKYIYKRKEYAKEQYYKIYNDIIGNIWKNETVETTNMQLDEDVGDNDFGNDSDEEVNED